MIPWWRPLLCWAGWHCQDCEHRLKRCCCVCHKRLWWAILAAILIVPSPAAAKPFYRDWKWWVGYGATLGAIGLDLASTARVQYVCAGCQETNLFSQGGTHLVRIGLIDAALEGGVSIGLTHFARKHDFDNRWTTISDFMEPAGSWAEHGWAAGHNYALARQVYANHVAQDIPLPGGQTPWRTK